MADLDREELLRIREVICADSVALRRWSVVVDNLVNREVDVLRIKYMLKKNEYAEAVLRTLQFTKCDLGQVLEVLRRQGINSLAGNIRTGPHHQPESTSNHIWYKVVELQHDFPRRNSDSAYIHTRLSNFHSNCSVKANIVCISGPAGCGKSTLARKYAWDNYSFYDSNVIWIEAGSVDEMRISFEGLGAELKLPAESDVQKLVTSVYKFFNRRKCLFIFDGLQRMEDFSQFRPNITSPLYQTPYLLITSTRSGLAPNPDNELYIAHDSAIVLQIFKRIEREEKFAADLLKVLAYLDPDKNTLKFLEALTLEVFGHTKPSLIHRVLGMANTSSESQASLTFLEKYRVIQLSKQSVIIASSVQEAIRSSLTAEEECSALKTITNTHQALMDKHGVTGKLTRECTAHRLHVLRLDLKSISLTDHFDRLWHDVLIRSEYSSALSIAQDAHAIFKSRFGENHEATIYAVFRMADSYDSLENYTEAIRILESLLLEAKSVLGGAHETTHLIRGLLWSAYESADKIAAETSGSNYVWFGVEELPHDLAGGDSASAGIHKRLNDFHSHRSVNSNIVCISGPPGAGKSTLASKYAFDNFPSEYSDVIWVDAQSIESMRSSFEKLATSKLGVPVEESNSALAGNVYEFFNNRKCLFIFDGLQRKEDFDQFRPKITNPLFQTPYLLFTSRRSGLAPDPDNELCIGTYKSKKVEVLRAMVKASVRDPAQDKVRLEDVRSQTSPNARKAEVPESPSAHTNKVAALSSSLSQLEIQEPFGQGNSAEAVRYRRDWAKVLASIELQNKSAARLLHVLAYLDPDKITMQFLQEVISCTNRGLMQIILLPSFEASLALLEKCKAIQVSKSYRSISILPTVQVAIRSNLSVKEESSVLKTIRNTHQALMDNHGVRGKLTSECIGHRLHVLRLDLKNISLTDHFHQLCYDFWIRNKYSSELSIAQHAHAILRSRFGEEENEATIYALFKMAHAYDSLENYTEAIRILESLLPVAKSVLGEKHQKTGWILVLLWHAYESGGTPERTSHYVKEFDAFNAMRMTNEES